MEKNKPKYLINKRQRKNAKIPRIIIQQKEPNYISKYRIDSYKLELEELSEKEFIYKASEYFFGDLIYKKYFEVGELFSLNKNSSYKEIQKINILLNELKRNEFGSPRVIFFQSPPMVGISYIIRYFNNNSFKFMIFNNSFGLDNNANFKRYLNKEELISEDYKDGSILSSYQRIFNIMRERNNNNIIEEKKSTYFIVLKNLPYELFLMALNSNNYTPNFIKNWKYTILLFFSEIKNLLEKKESNIKLIFFTDDKEIDEYELKTIFPKYIIDSPLTKNIICNPISKRRMVDILYNFLNALNPQIISENNINSFIESIYLEFNSNLQQILNHLLFTITGEYYNNKKEKKTYQYDFFHKPQTQKRINSISKNNESQNKTKNRLNKSKNNNKDFQIKKEKILDHDLFRLLGKLLYNKRYVVNRQSIEKLKKEEFGNVSQTPRYYDINELINDIPISFNSFNDLLMYNSLDHFNDIGEYSDTYDLYSFTDTIDNFNSFLFDKNNQYFHNNNYMKIYLNCLGITTYNLSQYNNNKKFNYCLSEKGGLMNIRKPDTKINNNLNKFNDQLYYKACEHYPCLISLSRGNFYKEGIFDIYKIKCLDENNNIKKDNVKNKSYENINYYYKEKANKKFLESNEQETNFNNKNNINNNTPKCNKFRNIPEEDQKALDSFFNDNDNEESQTESEIEE